MGLTENRKRKLDGIYKSHTNPSSLSGIQRLLIAARKTHPEIKWSLEDVRTYLSMQDSYTLHKQTRKTFERRKTIASRPRSILTCDLADLSSLAAYNNNIRYLLVCIDVFSRFMQVRPLKTKNMQEVSKCIKEVVEGKDFRGVKRLFTDRGGEFKNKQVEAVLKKNNIRSYSTHSYEIKASIAERHVRTLKDRIYKYLTLNKTLTYINVLNELVESYNNREHRGLAFNTPHNVHYCFSPYMIRKLFKTMYVDSYKNPSKPKVPHNLSVGDSVRISSTARQSPFVKGYKPLNTREIFRVRYIDDKKIPGYYLSDLRNEHIDGIFYREELVPTTLPDTFDFEIIRSRRTKTGKKQYFVKWIGYPDSFSSYINESDIEERE